MEKVKKIADLVQNYWLIITLVAGLLSSGVTAFHYNVAMPIVDEHIEEVSADVMRTWINDSAKILINDVIKSRGTGFRGELEAITHINKYNIADTVGNIIKQVPKYRFYFNYQKGYNEFLLNAICRRVDTLDCTLWKHPKGYFVFRDSLGYVWDAPIIAGHAYFYPPYANNKRQLCYGL